MDLALNNQQRLICYKAKSNEYLKVDLSSNKDTKSVMDSWTLRVGFDFKVEEIQ